jgi:3-oxoacyl-[acyl-carrier-protein] synthase II
MAQRPPIAITGLGAVSSLGTGVEAVWASVAAGRDGLRPIERFSTAEFSTHLGGLVASPVRLGQFDGEAAHALCLDFAVGAAREALARAGQPTPGRRLALVFGSCVLAEHGRLHRLAEQLADAVGAAGPRLTVSTACASSTNALGFARELLEEDRADAVLAGGADALTPENYAGFHALGLLSPKKCAPFSADVGTTLGEGAGFLVLERADAAAARGARSVGALLGYGLSGDAYHATSPDPTGAGVARALRAAMGDAGLPPEAIDYVNAHGTGTAANDAAEWRALEQVFGDRAAALPVSSSKSYLGHAQGAAGVLELIVTLLCMERGVIPPTLHLAVRRPRAPGDPVAGDRPRPHPVAYAASCNSAFGGANATVIVGRPGTGPLRQQHGRPVYVAGVGVADPARGPVALEQLVPTADTRGLDPASRYLAAAVAVALADGQVALKAPRRERAGLFVGTTSSSPAMSRACRASIDERGLARLSASAFTHLVLNASSGVASRLLGLKGPTTTLSTGRGSGLAALVLAAQHLHRRDDADLLVAAAVDERPAAAPASQGEGAVGVVLTVERQPVRLLGWGLAGAGDAAGAVAQARAMAGLAPGEEGHRLASAAPLAGAEAAGSLFDVVEAVTALREERLGRALVVEAAGTSAALAVILEGRFRS